MDWESTEAEYVGNLNEAEQTERESYEKLQNAEVLLKKAKENHRALEEEISPSKSNVSKLKRQVDQTNKEYNDAINLTEKFRVKIRDLEDKLNDLRVKTRLNEKVYELEQQIQNKKDEIRAFTSNRMQLETQVDEAREIVNVHRKEVDMLNSKGRQLMSDERHLKREIAEFRSFDIQKRNVLESRQQTLKLSINSLESQINSFKSLKPSTFDESSFYDREKRILKVNTLFEL